MLFFRTYKSIKQYYKNVNNELQNFCRNDINFMKKYESLKKFYPLWVIFRVITCIPTKILL